MILLGSMIASGVGSNSRMGYAVPAGARSLTAHPPLVPAPATRPVVPPRAGSQRSTVRVEYGTVAGSMTPMLSFVGPITASVATVVGSLLAAQAISPGPRV